MKPHDPTRIRIALLALGMAGTAAAATTIMSTTARAQQPPAPTAAAAAPFGPGPVAAGAMKRNPSEIHLSTKRLNVDTGNAAEVRGRVEASDPQLVRLQRFTGSTWITLAKDEPDAKGRFVLRKRATDAGSDMVRVRYSGDVRNLPDTAVVGRLNAFREVGASWYGPGFYGRTTACGQTFHAGVMGVAHKTLPCGTSLTLRNGSKTVRVKVVDRGPYVAGRELDLSPAVKEALGFGSTGTVGVTA